MLTAIQIWQRLTQMGLQKSISDINTALTQVDQQAIFSQERARYTVEVWDKQSPINGVPAEQILQRQDLPEGGEVYLIYVDGRLLYLQPHDPFQAGIVPLTEDTVLDVANAHADQLAWQSAEEKIFEAVLMKLLS